MDSMAARWLDRAPEGWAALVAADPLSSPSHRPEVAAAFVAALPGFEQRFAAVERDGHLIGGAPLLVERRGGARWLHALPMLLSAAPIARAGEHAEVDMAVATAVADLAAELGAAGGEWALYRPGAPVDDAACERVGGETRWLEASVVDLAGGVEAALQRVSRKHRQAMRAARERGLRFAEEPAALEGAYALHLAQSRAWGTHRALPLPLSRELLAAGGPQPAARLFTIRRQGELVSAALALDGPHETFVWWSGTHLEGRRLNAFPLLLWGVVEWAAAAGRARVNLGASTGLQMVASFKSSMGAESVRYPVRWLDARHAGAPARAIGWLQGLVRRGRERGEERA
ncbi:MAG: GNAT family N-acetyltransferase [Candidatus Eisenbacteria bacterium]|nr:GNAT family N-acetyltransferase [Candidatus Eisenbacteria bacterium]